MKFQPKAANEQVEIQHFPPQGLPMKKQNLKFNTFQPKAASEQIETQHFPPQGPNEETKLEIQHLPA